MPYKDSARQREAQRQYDHSSKGRDRYNRRHQTTTYRDYQTEWWRKTIQRRSGRLAANVRDWSAFFEGLTEDEQHIAAHLMLTLADVDKITSQVVKDQSFDYAYLAHHFD